MTRCQTRTCPQKPLPDVGSLWLSEVSLCHFVSLLEDGTMEIVYLFLSQGHKLSPFCTVREKQRRSLALLKLNYTSEVYISSLNMLFFLPHPFCCTDAFSDYAFSLVFLHAYWNSLSLSKAFREGRSWANLLSLLIGPDHSFWLFWSHRDISEHTDMMLFLAWLDWSSPRTRSIQGLSCPYPQQHACPGYVRKIVVNSYFFL